MRSFSFLIFLYSGPILPFGVMDFILISKLYVLSCPLKDNTILPYFYVSFSVLFQEFENF